MKWLLSISLLLITIVVNAQEHDTKVVKAIVIDGDTIPNITLDEVEILLLKYPTTKRGQRKLSRYVRYVKHVLPYAKLAAKKIHEYEIILLNAKSDKERKKIMKQAEKELSEEFGDDLRDMTFTQGLILIKLIDRETGETSYDLVQELRGNFRAFFYQAFARIWGFNLKTKYDPDGEDRQLEAIVRLIEMGRL